MIQPDFPNTAVCEQKGNKMDFLQIFDAMQSDGFERWNHRFETENNTVRPLCQHCVIISHQYLSLFSVTFL